MAAILIREMNLWPLLIPFAFFAGAFTLGAIAIRFIASRSKMSQSATQYGNAKHLETPIWVFDVHPEGKLDPRLARIPLYPGATQENPTGAQSVTEVRIAGRTFQDITATYWTPDAPKQSGSFIGSNCPIGRGTWTTRKGES